MLISSYNFRSYRSQHLLITDSPKGWFLFNPLFIEVYRD
nr:MAG TPA: hypothetical protein [Bacteriophage sp.]DAS09668.1 MAG TPA: hypothetical protein [Bacteriophage sp.]